MHDCGVTHRCTLHGLRQLRTFASLTCVNQPFLQVMASAQLERSKDVAAQSAAIAQLAALRPTSYGVVNALRACMQHAATYCR